MKGRVLLRVAFGLALVGALISAALAWNSRVGRVSHDAYARQLLHLVEVDARLNQQIAESHMGFTTHYDDLVRTWDQLDATRRTLSAVPAFVPVGERDALNGALTALSLSLDEKESLVERFKTERAVLRNTERALPVSVARLEAALAQRGTDLDRWRVAALLDDVFLQSLHPTPERHARALCSLAAMAPHRGDGPSACGPTVRALESRDPVLQALAAGVRQQGEVFVERQPVVEELVRALMTLPVVAHVSVVSSVYDRAHAGAVEDAAARLRVAEGLGALTILLGAALLVRRLQDDADALRETTHRLHEANEALKLERDREVELARLKGRFVSMTSHEFRTPLAVILSSAELLEAYGEGWDGERRSKHLHRIEGAGRAMSRLIDRVLVIGRADAELLECQPAPTDLPALVAVVMAEVQAGETGSSRLSTIDESTIQTLVLDERLLRHILINLLSNALKYSPEDSVVSLRVQADEGGVRFEVRDAGIGIPAAEMDTLFEPFHRCSNAADIPGTGLGLAIVRRAVDAHDGSIRVESQMGEGTIFHVHVPTLLENA